MNWTEESIVTALKKIIKVSNIKYMPTHSVMREYTGNHALSNAVRRYGGTEYWAKLLQLPYKECESTMGTHYERRCASYIESQLGYTAEAMKPRYPYDLLVDDAVKVDVKAGKCYHGQAGSFYTFSLEKRAPTCDLFIAYCIRDDGEVHKIYVIPSSALTGLTQLSIGVHRSKYDRYLSAWEQLHKYTAFFKAAS